MYVEQVGDEGEERRKEKSTGGFLSVLRPEFTVQTTFHFLHQNVQYVVYVIRFFFFFFILSLLIYYLYPFF
jgi:hypothetical protein